MVHEAVFCCITVCAYVGTKSQCASVHSQGFISDKVSSYYIPIKYSFCNLILIYMLICDTLVCVSYVSVILKEF